MLSKKYWNNRYLNNEIGWDIGEVSEPIKNWFNYQSDKSKKILIPGAGSGHEVWYAYSIGFENIYYLDFSTLAANKFKATYPKFPTSQIISGDFFTLLNYSGFFDIIIEQTFFCAINPKLRHQYVKHSADILSTKGQLVGLLFNDMLNNDHPPFGGNKEEYVNCFSPYYNINVMDTAYNSIGPRKNRELFINLTKK